ncbi:hypothetical protein BCR41DRAFT_400701 [Lobosporangium transversale]|uniref:Uncharacterized protein n=1 Tax=Lobosporangium transversale TaxID=64571 RepID=A0A1Y2G9Y4_9FUNG|nr:hypothetical protein BCR41DRAFT_400701 [Lobosporangium transversale]ORZ05161.1 hypothetical protein BCR41DRAFT_400701 [Lobosporangium transversale]|eukprot:XP_021876936.1 hypothetical protein BCR41DRAFT_400701 [Lobosporangium transversale]
MSKAQLINAMDKQQLAMTPDVGTYVEEQLEHEMLSRAKHQILNVICSSIKSQASNLRKKSTMKTRSISRNGSVGVPISGLTTKTALAKKVEKGELTRHVAEVDYTKLAIVNSILLTRLSGDARCATGTHLLFRSGITNSALDGRETTCTYQRPCKIPAVGIGRHKRMADGSGTGDLNRQPSYSRGTQRTW